MTDDAAAGCDGDELPPHFGRYRATQVGSLRDIDGDEITNLRQYLEHQATTVGHINGEGHCEDVIATH